MPHQKDGSGGAGFELAAIYSRTAERASEYAAAKGFAGPTFTDLQALAASDGTPSSPAHLTL